MRFGLALDLHATAADADEVGWERVREQVVAAEAAGLDLVVVPDHLAYRAGGDGDYATADAAVGVRESTTVLAAIAAVTSRIGVGHSVVNAPYRTPAMLAHVAATLAEISKGRYSLGIGVGNSFDYDQLGIAADRRVARFEEAVQILHGLLHDGRVDLRGEHWAAERAELVLRPAGADRPPLIVAAGGPRTTNVAARFGDGWNGWFPTDPEGSAAVEMLRQLDEGCERVDRDPTTIVRTGDLAVDPLDLQGARARSAEALARLDELGVDEVRCYTIGVDTAAARLEGLHAFADLVGELRPG